MPKRVGVYLPDDILSALGDVVERGRVSVSRVIQEALRWYLSERKVPDCELVGFVNVLYDHEVEGSDETLTDVQHEFSDIVVFANHVHLDKRRCLLAVSVRGRGSSVRDLMYRLEGAAGVLMIKPVLICVKPEQTAERVEG